MGPNCELPCPVGTGGKNCATICSLMSKCPLSRCIDTCSSNCASPCTRNNACASCKSGFFGTGCNRATKTSTTTPSNPTTTTIDGVCQPCDSLLGDDCTDLSALQECVLVNGDLISSGITTTTISNPSLTLALGDLVLYASSSIQVIEFPSLTEARGVAVFGSLSAITTLDLPALTSAHGFYVGGNNMLARLLLPELRIVELDFLIEGLLTVRDNNILTYFSVPKLTLIRLIRVCANNAGFVFPNALDMTAPVGGLVVTGLYKGTSDCRIQNGTGSCLTAVTCP